MDNRPTWDEFFIAIAAAYSSRGTCDRLRTACILVKDKKIVGAGYNGSVAGLPICDEIGHLMIDDHCLRTLHGEDNAIANAVSSVQNATAYIICTPCLNCIKKLLQYGITRIVYVGEYQNAGGKDLIEDFCRQKRVALEQMFKDARDVYDIFSKKIFRRLQGPGGIFQNLTTPQLIGRSERNIMKTMKEGKLIIFEGGEKSGKSTQVERLAGYILGKGYQVFTTKEPGGGMHDLRKQIMDLDQNDPNLAEREIELFEKDREIHYREKILPLLMAGVVVVCDRGPATSIAYQGYARGMDLEKIRKANDNATFGRKADLTILLDLPPHEYLKRMGKDHESEVTRFEKEKLDFHEKVREGFLTEAKKDPEKWVIINAILSKEDLTHAIQKSVGEKLGL